VSDGRNVNFTSSAQDQISDYYSDILLSGHYVALLCLGD